MCFTGIMDTKKFKTVDEYISTFPEHVQTILENIRTLVHKRAPGVEEAISYKIPTFKLNGTYLIYMAGWEHYISMYPVSSATKVKGLAPYLSGKGTVKFPLHEPIPYDLIEEIIRVKVKEHLHS